MVDNKTPEKPKPNHLKLELGKDENELDAMAKMALRPTIQGARTLTFYAGELGELDLTCLVAALTKQSEAVIGGDLSQGESMLTAQAHTLDAMFNSLARRSHANMGNKLDVTDRYMRLALKAQSQCRTTWETLLLIKNPPIAGYIKQANIAHGHQQVNNGKEPDKEPRAREIESQQNKLLEKTDAERLDLGTPAAASSENSAVEAVGKIHRAKDTRRKSKSGA